MDPLGLNLASPSTSIFGGSLYGRVNDNPGGGGLYDYVGFDIAISTYSINVHTGRRTLLSRRIIGSVYIIQQRQRGTGPVPRPGPDPNDRSHPLNREQADMLDPAVTLALQWLEANAECQDYINGGTGADAWDILDKLDRGGGFRYMEGSGAGSAHTRTPGRGAGATIDLYDGFFSADPDGLASAGGEGVFSRSVSTLEARAMIVLHEVRHAITGTPHGETAATGSKAWNEKVFEKCVPKNK